MKPRKSGFSELAHEFSLYPEESLLKVKEKNKSLFIGIPKEVEEFENRLMLTPEAVSVLVNNGHEIWIESGAGLPSKFSDKDFSEAGAQIVYTSKEVYSADIILKVMPPNNEELAMMKNNQTLISAIQLAKVSKGYINQLLSKKITSVALEFIEDKVGGKPIVRAMSEISGSTVMLIAAEYLGSHNGGKGIILGGITGVAPTNVVILGAGSVAEYTAKTAMGLGAEVKIFDNHIYKLRRLKQTLGVSIFTSTIDDNAILKAALLDADVVVGALRSDEDRSPCVITEEMVSSMKPDSIIIDVSIDQGGCFETSEITTHKNPVYRKFDVIHYCVPNIAARVSRTATTALSNIITPIIKNIANYGGVEELILNKDWFSNGVYSYRGSVTNYNLAKRFDLVHKDLKLLLAARM